MPDISSTSSNQEVTTMNIRSNLPALVATVALAVSVGGGLALANIQNSDTAAQRATISQQAKTISGLSAEVSALKAKVASPASNLGICYAVTYGETVDLADGNTVTPVTSVQIQPTAATYGQPCISGTTYSYVPVTPQKTGNGS